MKPFYPNCKPGTELRYDAGELPRYFVGITRGGDICYETDDGCVDFAHPSKIFMATRKEVKWAVIAISINPVRFSRDSHLYDTEEAARGSITNTTYSFAVARVEWEE